MNVNENALGNSNNTNDAESEKTKVLIVDDDKSIADAIAFYLRGEGYEPVIAQSGIEALNIIKSVPVSIALMDIMMPGLDGIQTTLRIREEYNIPIIMLSAKSEYYDKIMGLNVGADDYVTKPFNPLELIARVKSQLRRYNQLGSAAPAKSTAKIVCGGLEIDDYAKEVTVDGEVISLTPTEYGIIKLLASEAGRVFSIEQIYEAVWNEEAYNPENTVAVHIRRIREKIEIDPKNPRYLKVVWGVGYKIEKM